MIASKSQSETRPLKKDRRAGLARELTQCPRPRCHLRTGTGQQGSPLVCSVELGSICDAASS
jgi:hypothetical protein